MEYWLAERQLLSDGPVASVYVLHGQESFLHTRFLQLLRERLFAGDAATAGLNTAEIDGAEHGWDAALAAARTMPFLADRRLVVYREPPGLAGSSGGGAKAAADAAGSTERGQSERGQSDRGQTELEQQLEAFLAAPPPSTCLALVATAVDKRRRLFKLLDKHATVVDCAPLKPAEMAGWLRRRTEELGGRINGDAAEALALQIAPDLHIADQELRKLITYAADGPIDVAAVKAVASASAEAVIWPLLDAVGQRRPQTALALLRELLQQGEPPLRLLFMITRQWRHLLQCKALYEKGVGQKDIAAALGVPPFAVRNLLGQQRNFTREQLRRGMAQLLETDVQLKSSPTEPRLLLEMCILGLCA